MAYGFNDDKSKASVLPLSAGPSNKLTGPLYIKPPVDDMNPDIRMYVSDADVTKTDNDLSSPEYVGLRVYDKNSFTIGSFESTVNTDGSVRTGFFARNHPLNSQDPSEFIHRAFQMIVDKNGNTEYSVADPPAFRKAIHTINCNDVIDGILGTTNRTDGCWILRGNISNSNNQSRDDHNVGLILENNGLTGFDFTSNSSMFNYRGQTTHLSNANNQVIVPQAGATLNHVSFNERNGVVHLWIGFTLDSIVPETEYVLGTLVSGKRPIARIDGSPYRPDHHTCKIEPNGQIITKFYHNASASAEWSISFVYLIP